MEDISLYSYKNDKTTTKIPEKHVKVIDPTSQRKECKKFFENNVELWSKYYEKDGNPYKFNLPILKSILAKYDKKSLFDIGCGTGIPLIEFAKMGYDVSGCDFVEAAVSYTQENLKAQNISANIFQADIEEASSFPNEKFDAVVSIGVFPHLMDEKQALNNVKSILNEDGIALLQFRNDLFNLFTLNSYSIEFFKEMTSGNLPNDLKIEYDKFLKENLTLGGISNEFSMLSKFHNPLSIEKELFEPCGFKVKKIHFFHYHILPPYFQVKHKKSFLDLSEQLEQSDDWRGNFMASSFIVEAQL